jgi:exodeoxyribonuclease VII large subunit
MPREGERVHARGDVSIYPARSEYQFNIRLIRPAGIGALYLEFERLKAELDAEGLFDAARKRPLPGFPHTIGIVTSPEAAALQDVLHVLRRRFPLAHVVLAPTSVQGDDAPPQIVRALDRLNARPDLDVILICRGGGSLEDLWAFNDARVVRAVAASRLPVISGVGHETDFTLTDFAADVRAPTPSAAAAMLTPDSAELRARLLRARADLTTAMRAALDGWRDRLTAESRLLERHSPRYTIVRRRQDVDTLALRLERAARRALDARRERLRLTERTLYAASPQAILDRGYALVSAADGARVTSAEATRPGDRLRLRFHDGSIEVTRTG